LPVVVRAPVGGGVGGLMRVFFITCHWGILSPPDWCSSGFFRGAPFCQR
jgi:hypothetical protein